MRITLHQRALSPTLGLMALTLLLGAGGCLSAEQRATLARVDELARTQAAQQAAHHETMAALQARLDGLEGQVASLRFTDGVAGPPKGGKNPLVHIVEFSDFQCPFCWKVQATLQKVLDTYGDDVALSFHHQPLSFHKDARGAAIASIAAARQGAFWRYHDALFANQRQLNESDLMHYATELGLDLNRFRADLRDPAIAAAVDRDQKLANAVGATGTPGFFVNGRKLRGAQPFDKFKAVIDEEIAAAGGLEGAARKAFVDKRSRAANADLVKYLAFEAEPPAKAPATADQRPVDKTVYKVTVGRGDPIKGNIKAALVSVVVFSDFQCPYCARHEPTLEKVLETYGNDVRLVFKQLPLPFHKDARPAAEAALCAHDQGMFWPYHDKLFANMRALKPDDLERYAEELGLAMKPFRRCVQKRTHKGQVERDERLAQEVTARGTPNTFVNGRKITGAVPFERFKDVVDEELTKARAMVAAGTPRKKVYAKIITGGQRQQGEVTGDKHSFDLGPAPKLGSARAKVKIVVFTDFQCPFCSRLVPALREVKEKYKRKVVIVHKHFPLSFHKQAMPAAKASVCAHRQGKFWEYHDLLFDNQRSLDPERLRQLAATAGVGIAAFDRCLQEPKVMARVLADMAEGRKAGVSGTPSVYINGRKFGGAAGFTAEAFSEAIDGLKKKRK